MLKDKGNILAIIVVILLLFIVVQTYIFPKQTQVINKYEVKQGKIVNEDSLKQIIYEKLSLKLDSELVPRQKELIKIKNEIIRLQNRYKIVRVSTDSLPYF